MSETQKSVGSSTVDNQMSGARKVQRRADGDVMTFFDDDGSLIPAEQADEVASNETTVDVEEDAEAFLAEVAPERLASVEKKAGNLPGTREELIEFQARKVIKQAEERGEALHVESGGVEFTVHQVPSKDKWAALDNTMNEDGKTLDECPKCGAEDVSASQVEIQTKGADESGTQVTKTGCGCTIRRTD